MRIKNYLSYSQYATYTASEKAYINAYILGKSFRNKYLDFGSKVADVLDNRDKENKDVDEQMAVDMIEKTEFTELALSVKFGIVPLFGRLDGYNSKTNTIIEYKTGKIPWTQSKADKHIQLLFYAIMISIEYNIKIEDINIELIWMETVVDTDGKIILTGRKEIFKTKRTKIDMIKIYPKIKNAWIGIEKLINQHLK